MSYILDALKKSEQEREQGKVPDIKTVHTLPTAAPQQHQSSWLYIVVISIVLAAGGVYLWNHFFRPSPPMEQEAATTVPVNPQLPSAAVEKQVPLVQKSDDSKPVIPKIRVATNTPAKPAPIKQPQNAKKTEQKDGTPKSNVVFLKNEIPDDQLYSTQPYEPSADNKSTAKAAKKSAAVQRSHVTPTVPQEPEVIDVTGLPADIRKRLPDINFTGHVYSNVPKRRSVIINGKQMREGEFVNADLKLEKITSKGVVLSFGDVWFRLGAMQDWSNH